MSDLRVALVAEGPTEFEIIRAFLTRFIGDAYVAKLLQPDTPSLLLGSKGTIHGWKGVFEWCNLNGGPRPNAIDDVVLQNFDVLVIHVDADIAHDQELSDLNLYHACPPARPTCDAIRNYVQSIIGGPGLPAEVIFCVPAQSTELWVFAALYAAEFATVLNPECLTDPKIRLYAKPERLVRLKDGKYRNQPEMYRAVKGAIASGWPIATAACAEAKRFEDEFTSQIKI